MNAVVVKGDAVGATQHYGAGAGSLATASSVVADLVNLSRVLAVEPANRVPHLGFQPSALSELKVVPIEDIRSSFYLRLRARDESGVLAKITKALADRDISIEAFLQKEAEKPGDDVDIVLLTNIVSNQQIADSITELEALNTVTESVASFHVEMFTD